MRILRFLALGALVGAVTIGAGRPAADSARPGSGQGQQPTFRSGAEVVSLNVTVTDPEGRYVTDLGAEAFGVFEDGVQQDLKYFTRTNLPLALSLLLDTSASMDLKLGTAQEAAVGFARQLREQDLGEVIDFDSRVEVIQGFTNRPDDLERAVRKTTAGGSTSLYNAVYIALKELKRVQAKTQEELRRQAIIVLSDGEDTSSLVTFDEVLDLAKRSETAIYTIGLRSREDLAGKGFKEADFVLRELARETGARVFFPARVDDLAGVYEQIADELSSQYQLGYVPRNTRRDGNWRRVVVRVARPNVMARAKQGYFAPSPK